MFTSPECITGISDETKAKVGAHMRPTESISRSYIALLHLDLDYSDMNFK